MNIIIRNAHPNESIELGKLAIRSKAFWGYSDDFMKACHDELLIPSEKIESDNYYYFVAENKNHIVGYYALEKLPNLDFELEALFVEPKLIGTGIGKDLMNHAKKFAALKGAHTIIIQGDPNATSFYLAAGGKLTGEKESVNIQGRFLPTFEICLSSDNEI